jgi:hypothetical protein
MIPTGSRLLIAATLLAATAAVVYGVSVGGSLGTMGLISAAAALLVPTVINIYTRDANVSSMDPAAATESTAARPAPWRSMWPAVGALGGVLVVVGLVTYPVVFVFGIIALLAAVVEWMIAAWAERASGEAVYNAEVRRRIAHPAEFPVLAALTLGIVVYSFSRIMLFLSKASGPAAFGTIAALVLAAGFLFAFRSNLNRAAVVGVVGIALIGLVTGGIAAALSGERDIEEHETLADVEEEGECSTPDETHADENAGQNVAATAALHATVTLRDDGTLVVNEVDGPANDRVTFVRANTTNVLFENETDEERRLVLDLGEQDVENEETGETETVAHQLCTALVDEGGTQLLTFSIYEPSAVAGPYEFFVPGVDGETIEVIVP